jgi:hypothetical protein
MSEIHREVAIDAATNRMGHIMTRDRERGQVVRVWLRPLNGGLEWEAHPDSVVVASDALVSVPSPYRSSHRLKPDFTGSENEVLSVIWGTSARLDLGRSLAASGVGLLTVEEASALIDGGEPVVAVDGRLYRVAEPEWSVEQDVYGCEDGRDCQDVTDEDRVVFEAMIAERLARQDSARAAGVEP